MVVSHLIPCGSDLITAVVTPGVVGDGGALAVLVHGGPGGDKDGPGGLFVDLAAALAGQGIATLRFDFAGCGQSSGQYRDMTISGQVDQLAAVVDYARRIVRPTSIALVGESYGATIAALAADQVGCRCLVMLYPVVWMLDGAFESYVTDDKLREAQQRGYIVQDGQQVGLGFLREVLEICDVSESLWDLPGVPALFVHGDADREVPCDQSVRAAVLMSGPKRVVIVPGGGHCLDRPADRDVVRTEVTAWLARWLPRPSWS